MRIGWLGRRATAQIRVRHLVVGSVLAGLLGLSVVPAGAPAAPAAAASAPVLTPSGPCADLTVPENHASIRLSVDTPADGEQLSVDAQGQIAVRGVLHKHATMVDVSDGAATTSTFTLGPPPPGVAAWASSWTTSFRPPHLGDNALCARAVREPKRSARILRAFTVADLIPPSAVPGLTIAGITPTGATATWGAATDNYGLAGYEVTVDGGTPQRTSVGTRTWTIAGLEPATSHAVAVVALDLGGNRSAPATTSFTTDAAPPPPPPPPPGTDLTVVPEVGSALASWQPAATDVSYRVLLDWLPYADVAPADFCVDAQGNPVDPCTPQDVVRYPVTDLESATSYGLRVEAVAADGTTNRTLVTAFTTPAVSPLVPPATVQQIASESRQCAGVGGSFYLTPSLRGRVPIPAGAAQLFAGCWKAADSSCVDAILPPSKDGSVGCSDDVTRYLQRLAPPGHGPLLDFVAPALLVPPPQPITACFTGGACTIVLERAAEAVATTAVAAAEGATVAGIVVVAAEIVIAVALAAVLVLIFATELGIAGLFEYPIRYDTDFTTFDNWGANKGRYYDSLQIYAEIIATTDDVARDRNLAFAWNQTQDQILKLTIDRACTAQQGRPSVSTPGACGNGFAVYVPGAVTPTGGPMPQTGRHIVDTMSDDAIHQNPARVQWFYPGHSVNGRAAATKGFPRQWYDRVAALQPNSCTDRVRSTSACDEFPFWSTDQAVNLSGVLADLRPVPVTESQPQANDLSTFYSRCKVAETDRFLVVPIAPWVAANGPSLGFRVGQGRAALCHGPGVGG